MLVIKINSYDKVVVWTPLPKTSEMFRKPPEGFGSVPHSSEKREGRTLTVREVARMFEKSGVAKTERSIVTI